MPNYEDDIKEAGWVKDGKHWVHPDKPGVKYWAAMEVYQKETFPGKRPYSAVPPETPPAPPASKPAAATPAKPAVPAQPAKPAPKPEPKHVPKKAKKRR